MFKLVDIYKKWVANKLTINFLPILKAQSNDSNLTDPEKQTVSQVLLLKRPKQAYEVKSVQYLASHEPKGIASFETLQPC